MKIMIKSALPTRPLWPRNRNLVSIVALLVTLLVGCGRGNSTSVSQREIIRQSEDLSKEYLQADASHAKQCLESDARLLEEATVLEPSGRADLLSLAYFRLYSLETRTGNEVGAKVNLIKARYWRLTSAELGGAKAEEAVGKIELLSSERIFNEVDQFDMRHNNGAPAKYVQTLKNK
jgi:hypothetical protein